jgi:hypothetical protein
MHTEGISRKVAFGMEANNFVTLPQIRNAIIRKLSQHLARHTKAAHRDWIEILHDFEPIYSQKTKTKTKKIK